MNLVSRAQNIIVSPKFEWEKIDLQPETMQTVITKYVIPLAGIAAICTFIGYSFIGHYATVGLGLRMAAITFISQVVGVIVTAYVVDALAPSFNSQKNIHKSTQLVAYGYTPAFIGAFLTIFPTIAVIGSLFGLYGIYLMYLGLGPLKRTPEDKKVIYLVVTIVVLMVIYFVIAAILGGILLRAAYTTPTV